jgi:hypothetical protein
MSFPFPSLALLFQSGLLQAAETVEHCAIASPLLCTTRLPLRSLDSAVPFLSHRLSVCFCSARLNWPLLRLFLFLLHLHSGFSFRDISTRDTRDRHHHQHDHQQQFYTAALTPLVRQSGQVGSPSSIHFCKHAVVATNYPLPHFDHLSSFVHRCQFRYCAPSLLCGLYPD